MRHVLCRDNRGVVWDALLYVPTVTALGLFAFSTFYDGKVEVAYLLGFLACFFLFVGANRILTTRLMLLPTAPVAIETGQGSVGLVLRNAEAIWLRREIKVYRDKPPRSFGLTGLDDAGRRRQFVFHRGQFGSDGEFQTVIGDIERAAAGRG